MGGDGDGWVDCSCGRRHWGLHGAAGLLVVKEDAVLLQHRSPSSHNGSTWGLPGGARDSGETAEEAALREAHEEAGIQSELIDIHLVHAENHGNWTYDTVIATGRVGLSAYAANHESLEVKWVPLAKVAQYDLHPSFAKAWPELLRKIVDLLAILNKGANVSGLSERIQKEKYMSDKEFLGAALAEAKLGRSEGGVPVGAALAVDGKLLGVGHNKRVQLGSAIRHGETDCLENIGRLPASVYQRSTLYTTLSPCDMCTGAILLYGIPRVVVGENVNFMGNEELLRSRGVEVVVVQDADCIQVMGDFIKECPEIWNEDIGV